MSASSWAAVQPHLGDSWVTLHFPSYWSGDNLVPFNKKTLSLRLLLGAEALGHILCFQI